MSEIVNINFKEDNLKNIKDRFGNPARKEKKGIQGRVQIYERTIEGTDKKIYLVEDREKNQFKKIRDTSNLIVYRGRSWLLQRAFNLDLGQNPNTLSYSSTDRQNWKNMFIAFFAVGTGGAAGETPLNPISVSPGSTDLNTFGSVSGTIGKYMTVDSKEYHVFEEGYPTFHSDIEIETEDYADLDGTVTFEDDLLDSSENPRKADSFLIARIQTRLTQQEANGAGTQNINEAGLYLCTTNDVGDASGLTGDDLQLFAKVSFETIPKHNSKEIVFNWYIQF